MNLKYLFVRMIVYNKQLLFNMHGVNIKVKVCMKHLGIHKNITYHM